MKCDMSEHDASAQFDLQASAQTRSARMVVSSFLVRMFVPLSDMPDWQAMGQGQMKFDFCHTLAGGRYGSHPKSAYLRSHTNRLTGDARSERAHANQSDGVPTAEEYRRSNDHGRRSTGDEPFSCVANPVAIDGAGNPAGRATDFQLSAASRAAVVRSELTRERLVSQLGPRAPPTILRPILRCGQAAPEQRRAVQSRE